MLSSGKIRRNHHDTKIAGLYDLEETLGRGHFAIVKRARHVFTGEKVAVKVIDKMKLDDVSRAHLYQEVRCMKLVQHPNVVRLYQVIDTQTKLYLILELGDGGDLYDYIMKHDRGLGEDMAREYFKQIVRAISYCHQLHVVHRDLKPENVVFFEKLGVVKLTDFGFSNKFYPGQKLETSCGSLAYSAPEILLGDSYDAPAVDVWSLGVILYMLVVGHAPFQEANDSETLTMIMDCKYKVPGHVSSKCRRLIARMLVREPDARATLSEIASDPWLGDYDLNAEYMPLVSHHQLTEEDQALVINKMVSGGIATKEEILDALEKNEYNHITATYYLIAERKLRLQRIEDAQARANQTKIIHGLSAASKSSQSPTPPSPTPSVTHLAPPLDSTLVCQSQTNRLRKCSIVHEEEDDEEEEYTKEKGGSSSARSSLNRRGSRSEGKISQIVQERLAAEEHRRCVSKTHHPVDDSCRNYPTSPPPHRLLTDSATSPFPLPSSASPSPPPLLSSKYKTLPSSSTASSPLNEISEEGCFQTTRAIGVGATGRRHGFRKARTASCSSSEAEEEEGTEGRKKGGTGGARGRRQSRDGAEDDGPGPPGSAPGGSTSHTSGPSDAPDSSSDRGATGAGSNAGTSFSANSQKGADASGMRRRLYPSGVDRLRESQSLNRIAEAEEPSKISGPRFLKSWSKAKLNPEEEKENRTRRIKLLGRYFQVSKKLFLPFPSLTKRRLYKARSCGVLSRDRVAPDTTDHHFLKNGPKKVGLRGDEIENLKNTALHIETDERRDNAI